MTIHQLDCIYYGEINKSYQKEGFGILQALSFEHYVGFWKNNKVEGLGLVIFPGGEVIYGEFSRNTLNGIGIVDDGKFLRLGVFEGKSSLFQEWISMELASSTPIPHPNGG
jgi:hypothetical protein